MAAPFAPHWLAALLIGFSLLTACSPGPAPTAATTAKAVPPEDPPIVDAEFWKQWGDGQAEVSSYDLTYPRYGHPRRGVAVTIFVSEPFSLEARVKADDGKHPATDVFPVMKLNRIEDFQTGVYDYNEQTSSFLALAGRGHQRAGRLTKVSFSSQEWCGHAWAQWLTTPTGLQFTGHSYFDGESDQSTAMTYPDGGVAEEQLMFWARGMGGPRLKPGESATVPFLRSMQWQRHAHKPAGWTEARLSRDGDTWRAEIREGPSISIRVEPAAPHRILEWQSSDGERGILIKSARMKYWEMNGPGGESELSRLGLSLRPKRTP